MGSDHTPRKWQGMEMDFSDLVSRLTSVAEHLGLDVRFERMEEQKGGMFRLRGKRAILVNEALPDEEKADVLGHALSGFDLNKLYLLPEVRDYIATRKRGGA